MKIIYFLFCLFIPFFSLAQTDSGTEVYLEVEQMPVFPGGEQALFEYISKEIKYPVKAREKGLSGTVYISFIVGLKGAVEDIKVLRGVSPELDEEAVRVIKNMPKWTEGFQNGKPARVHFQVPIKFVLLDPSKDKK